jgi:hypothetical protein
VKIGDLIRQIRMPGGICIFLGEETIPEAVLEKDHDPDMFEELYYYISHPTEGLIFDQSYYYEEIVQ